MTVADFFRDYASPIAWCVAALGWWVSNLQANNRERRKEVRSEIDDLGEVLTSLNEAVRTYYKFEPKKVAANTSIGSDCGSALVSGGAASADDPDETKIDAALEIKALAKEIDLRMQRISSRRWCYPSQQHLKEAKAVWESVYESVTGEYFETDKSMGSAEAAHAFFLRTKVNSIQFVEKVHAAALAHFDFF